MSDARDEIEPIGRLAIRSAGVEPLRERMRSFVDDQDEREPLETLRARTTTGTPLSELVDRGRDERIE